MSRYIDADEVRNPYSGTSLEWQGVLLLKLLDEAPTIDIVRCKECRYWQDNNNGYPHDECRWGKGETPDADDFCSYGERSEE